MNAIWIAVAAVSLLGLAFGAILGYASRRFAVEDDPVVEKIDEILPQSQCGQCGYPGCRPYAEAISCNGEKINRCAPGGEAVMLKIAELLNVEPQPLDGEAPELTPALFRSPVSIPSPTLFCLPIPSIAFVIPPFSAPDSIIRPFLIPLRRFFPVSGLAAVKMLPDQFLIEF